MASYTLYHFPFSVCSIMVRYTLAVRGPPKDDSSSMSVNETVIDIMREEQLSEHYLCEVNPKGQVPAMTSPSLPKPVTDSLDITHFVLETHPQLAPSEHKEEILELLAQLHRINFFSLTFTSNPALAQKANDKIRATLADPNSPLSARHRAALEYKIDVNTREKFTHITPQAAAHNAALASALLARCTALLPPEAVAAAAGAAGGLWLWGLARPTALDAHLVVFIARLQDIGRGALVPPALAAYAARAEAGAEWEGTMAGRRTVPEGGFGGVKGGE